MVKLQNKQIVSFESPIFSELMASKDRKFPTEDAFKIADIVETFASRIKTYRKTVKQIIEDCGGELNGDGTLKFDLKEDKDKADEEIEKLNEIEMDYQIKKVKMTKEWPELTIAEARILNPIVIRE